MVKRIITAVPILGFIASIIVFMSFSSIQSYTLIMALMFFIAGYLGHENYTGDGVFPEKVCLYLVFETFLTFVSLPDSVTAASYLLYGLAYTSGAYFMVFKKSE